MDVRRMFTQPCFPNTPVDGIVDHGDAIAISQALVLGVDLMVAGDFTSIDHHEVNHLVRRSLGARRLKKLWRRLGEPRGQAPARDELLMKLGAARKEAGRAWHLVDVRKPAAGEKISADTFTFALRRDRLRRACRREGRRLLRPRDTKINHLRHNMG